MADRYGMNDRQKAAREAAELQDAEQNADSALSGPPPGRDAQMREAMDTARSLDTAEGTQADLMPENQPVPEINAKQADYNPEAEGFDPVVAPPPDPGSEEAGEFLTRDRPNMDTSFQNMDTQELMDARNRLLMAMQNEGSGPQAAAYTVLLNRIERAIGAKDGS